MYWKMFALAALLAAGCRNPAAQTAANSTPDGAPTLDEMEAADSESVYRSVADSSPAPPAIGETIAPPGVIAQLNSLDAIDRRLAANPGAEPPLEVLEATGDPNPRVRSAALKLLAKHRHPKAHTYLQTAMSDGDAGVRAVAVAGLAEIGSSSARKSLQDQLASRSEIMRASAVKALASIGERTGLDRLAGDPAWRVRAEVAAALVNDATDGGLERATVMLDDSSVKVRLAAVDAAEEWPLDLAGPLWLAALDSTSREVREAAAKHLQANWPPAAEVWPPDDPAALREFLRVRPGSSTHGDAVAALTQRWDAEFGDRVGSVAAAADSAVRDRFTDDQLRAVSSLIETWQAGHLPQQVRDRAAAALLGYGEALPELLADWSRRSGVKLSEAVYTELLRDASPAWSQLAALATEDAAGRSAALQRLAEYARRRTLSDEELARLAQLLQRDEEPQLWGSALEMLGEERRPAALQLAAAATLSPNADVRRRGAQILAASDAPEFAGVLRALQSDPDQRVAEIARAAASTTR